MLNQSKKVYLVTGAAGFIGARFVESCHEKGIHIISVDKKAHFSMRPEKSHIDYGQIVDRAHLFAWLDLEHPVVDAVVHLGAVTDTRASDLSLLSELNTEYSKKLWNYAKKIEIPFIYASSAATYGSGAYGYQDDERFIPCLQPLNAYGDSKQKFDLWALEQEKLGQVPSSWVGFKFFNVYGFGERHKGFMSSVVLHAFEEIQSQGKVTLFKSHRPDVAHGDQKRDFVFVDDVVKVLHFAIEKPIRRGIFNLGTGKARAFLDLAKAVFKALDLPEKIQFQDTPLEIRQQYQYFTQATMDRLREEGFIDPFTTLESGVEQSVQRFLLFV